MARRLPNQAAPSVAYTCDTMLSQTPSLTASSMNIAGHTAAFEASRDWVDFYLVGIYDWTALGAAKAIEALENLNAVSILISPH